MAPRRRPSRSKNAPKAPLKYPERVAGPITRGIQDMVDFINYRSCPRSPGVEIDRMHHQSRGLTHRIMRGMHTCLTLDAAVELDREVARRHEEWLEEQVRINRQELPEAMRLNFTPAQVEHDEEHFRQYFPGAPYHTL